MGGTPAQVGLTSGNGVDFISHEYSFTSQVINIANARVPDSVMVDGMLVYRVDGSPDPFGILLHTCKLYILTVPLWRESIIIGGASAASAATVRSSKSRFAIYYRYKYVKFDHKCACAVIL